MSTRPKPGSKTDRDALRREMLAAGCSVGDIATEMRVRWRFRPREAFRHAHGLSLQETADRINDAAGASGVSVAADASLVGKWEKWPASTGRRPSPQILRVLAAVFACDVEQLLDFDDRRDQPRLRPANPVGERPVPSSTGDGDDLAADQDDPATAAEVVRQAADESAAWAAWAETTNVGDLALEQLHADVRRLATDYLDGDAVTVFARTRSLRDSVFHLLEGHQSPRQATDLYVAAGYLCALLAWMSSDLGHLADADTHGRTAWLCGQKAEHTGLLAWTASTRSKVAFWDGRLRDAVQHARRGATYRADGTVTALLASQEADAWSRLGAAEETESALRRAVAAREQVTGEDEVAGLFSCSLGRQEQYAAGCHLRVGAYSAALAEAESALVFLHSQGRRAYGTEAQTHISRAMSHVGLGQPDAVLETLLPVLQLRPEQRLDTVIGRMRDLSTLMATSPGARGSASVQTRAMLTDWCADSAPARLALSPGGGSS